MQQKVPMSIITLLRASQGGMDDIVAAELHSVYPQMIKAWEQIHSIWLNIT